MTRVETLVDQTPHAVVKSGGDNNEQEQISMVR